jgi:hypothetical protein
MTRCAPDSTAQGTPRQQTVRAFPALRSAAALGAALLLTGASLVSCSGDPIGGGGGSDDLDKRPASLSMGRWSPATDTTRFPNECAKDVHDSYFVVGPDGKKYPTWHPPRDPASGCWFGHEHGDNPAGSALWSELKRHFAWDANGNGTIDEAEATSARSGIPFGYAAEVGGDPAAILHDSYKIAFIDGVARQRAVSGSTQDAALRCNQLLAFAHDTQTSAAVGQALHPLTYAIDCTPTDGASYASKLILSVMADYGSTQAIAAQGSEAAAARRLPEATAQVYPSAFVALGATSDLPTALAERWDTIIAIRTSGGTELARANPGLENRNPSRYLLGSGSGAAAQASIGLCYSGLNAAGALVSDPSQSASIVRQVRGSATECARLSPTGPATTLANRVRADDREAQFKGCSRSVIWRDQTVRNSTGPTTWYSNASGADARSSAFTGGLRQYIARGSSGTTVVLAPFTDDASVDCDGATTGVHVRTAP